MRTLLAFVILFFVVAFARPVYAQEPTAEATVETMPIEVIATSAPVEDSGNDTIVNVGTPAPEDREAEDNVTSLVIGAALLVVVIFSGFALTIVSQLVPAGVAKELLDSGIKAGYQMALNRAALTPGTIDDQVYTALAGIQGLEVTRDAAGQFIVKQRAADPNAFISTPTDNLKS